eukprot:Gregarina_sp_Poly_1__858@NODE_1204_length_4788_cov_139_399068_g60_i2_p3_GENE_NODE_1204_length_4788_cov_139_399068_g60_i2NODE_1204_length_4788_cov_139_399068_g60_i2_p3_ORF_typecomplete_len256_score44_44_NODE_1204_length_4788_cov_139_399068_g60_i212392006
MSPDTQYTAPVDDTRPFRRDAFLQQRDSRLLTERRRPKIISEGSALASPSTYRQEPYLAPRSRLYQHTELSDDDDGGSSLENDLDIEFGHSSTETAGCRRRAMSRKLNRVPGDIGDEVVSLASQSSMASSTAMLSNCRPPLTSHPIMVPAQQESPSLMRYRHDVDARASATFLSRPSGSPQVGRQPSSLASAFSLSGQPLLRAAMQDYRLSEPPRLLPQGPSRYDNYSLHSRPSSGRHPLPEFPSQQFWAPRYHQ